jgi:hypothetical protein
MKKLKKMVDGNEFVPSTTAGTGGGGRGGDGSGGGGTGRPRCSDGDARRWRPLPNQTVGGGEGEQGRRRRPDAGWRGAARRVGRAAGRGRSSRPDGEARGRRPPPNRGKARGQRWWPDAGQWRRCGHAARHGGELRATRQRRGGAGATTAAAGRAGMFTRGQKFVCIQVA